MSLAGAAQVGDRDAENPWTNVWSRVYVRVGGGQKSRGFSADVTAGAGIQTAAVHTRTRERSTRKCSALEWATQSVARSKKSRAPVFGQCIVEEAE